MPLVFNALRVVVLSGFLFATAVALTDWAVRNRKLPPFGGFPLFMRKVSAPILKPLQARMVKAGHNPVDAPTWFFWLALLGGLVLLGLFQWLVSEIDAVMWAVHSGTNGVILFLVESVYSILVIALFIRVVSSWFGLSPYGKWMRPVMLLTNWLVEPIRRLLPPTGMFDFSPLVAYFLLYVVRILLIRAL